jgi:hypothetical protein
MGILVTYVVKLPRRGLRDSLRRGGLADRLLLRISYHMISRIGEPSERKLIGVIGSITMRTSF